MSKKRGGKVNHTEHEIICTTNANATSLYYYCALYPICVSHKQGLRKIIGYKQENLYQHSPAERHLFETQVRPGNSDTGST